MQNKKKSFFLNITIIIHSYLKKRKNKSLEDKKKKKADEVSGNFACKKCIFA